MPSWLERPLEPAFEDRFSSVGEALQALSPASASKIEHQYESLAKKRITLNKSSQILKATLPAHARISTPRTLFGIFLLLVGLGKDGSGLIILIFGLVLLRPMLSKLAVREQLKIDPQNLHVGQSFLGITIKHRHHPIKTIDRIELDLSLAGNDSRVYLICKGGEKYPFGLNLNRTEQLWLAREMSDFLKKLNS